MTEAKPGDRVGEIVVPARAVVDAVPATASDAALKTNQLVDELGMIEQPDAAGIDQRKQSR